MNYYELMIRRSRSVEPPAPAIPTDYVLYMPFTEDLLDHSEYERSFTITGTTPTLETVGNVPCATFPANTYMRTSDNTGFNGNGNVTLSYWLKFESLQTNSNSWFYAMGSAGSSHGCVSVGYGVEAGEYTGGIWGGGDYTKLAPCTADLNWHHLAYIFGTDSKGHIYLDGVEILVSTSTDSLSITNGGWGIGNTPNNFNWPPGVIMHYAGVRTYYRAVTNDELQALASEFTPTQGA